MSQLDRASYVKVAAQLRRQGKLEEAIATYHVAIETNPTFSWYHNSLGECLASQGKLDEAIMSYYKAIELNPSLGCFYYNLAEAFSKKKSLEQAIACYNQAAEITPDSYLFVKKLIEVLRKYDDLDQTLSNYFRKIDLTSCGLLNDNNPEILVEELIHDSDVRTKLGSFYFKIGQKLNQQGFQKESELILHSAIKLNDDCYWSHHLLACIFKGKRWYKQAIEHFRRAIKLNPGEFGHYWRLAQTYREKGDIDLAIEAYNMSLKLKKNDQVKQEFDALLVLNIVKNSELYSSKNPLANFNVEPIINSYLDCPDILAKLGDYYEKSGRIHDANRIKQAVSIYLELASSSQVLLIVFASRNDDRAHTKFQFRQLLSQVDIKKIFIRDVYDAWYNKGLKNIVDSIEGVAEYLKEQIEQIKPKKLITLGSSSGGYASLLFGFLLNADRSLAFSPQTKIPRPQPFPDSALLVDCDPRYFNLLDLEWGNVKTICGIHYSEDFISDKDAAIRMEKLANFKLYSYKAGKIHNIAGWLKNQGKLESILLEVIGKN
jgi:tetratricopeptide (TPR) repeat protein